jgi:hypothetical protein
MIGSRNVSRDFRANMMVKYKGLGSETRGSEVMQNR